MSSRIHASSTGLFHFLVSTFSVILIGTASALGITEYSGASVGTDGTIHGWGVMDAYVSGMNHIAYVTTTLRSPHNRTANSGRLSAPNTVRADVYLSWDNGDLGTYLVSTTDSYYCDRIRGEIPCPPSSASTTAPLVLLALRTSGPVFFDNSGLSAYQSGNGTTSLGVFYFLGIRPDQSDRGWRTGVEIDGTVLPSSFTGNIFIKRLIIEEDVYDHCTFLPDKRIVNRDDTTTLDSHLMDYNPQSGGSQGVVYDLDAPWLGFTDSAPAGSLVRRRTNFKQWAVILDANNQEVQVSGYLSWFTRLSVYKNGDGTTSLEASFAGDNTAGQPSTKLSCSLQ